MTGLETAAAPGAAGRIPLRTLFMAFLGIGMVGFGGVLPWLRRMVVEQRRWQSPGEFTDMLSFCQLMPGPNVVNFSVCFGGRAAGWRGSVAALSGLLGGPIVLVLALGAAYQRLSVYPVVAHAMAGLAAAACGLVLATALKIATPIRGRALGIAVAGAAFGVIALLRLPMLPSLLVLAPISVGLHLKLEGANPAGRHAEIQNPEGEDRASRAPGVER